MKGYRCLIILVPREIRANFPEEAGQILKCAPNMEGNWLKHNRRAEFSFYSGRAAEERPENGVLQAEQGGFMATKKMPTNITKPRLTLP